MDALSFVKLVLLPYAEALRERGVLRFEVDGCKAEFAPHQASPDQRDEEGEDDGDPEHPAFNPKIKLREYHKGSK
jgi:hypothetical protein